MEKMLANPAATLAAILVTITAANYAAEAVAASGVIAHDLPVWIAIVGLGALLIVFAEVVPISYATANPERVTRAAAVPVWMARALVSVPAKLLGLVAEGLVRLFAGRQAPQEPVTEGEIRAIVDLQAEAGELKEEEKAMIFHIFEFGDKAAREVMVPRTTMAAIPLAASALDAGKVCTERRISRLPVYGEDLDEIVGVVHVKDVLPLLASKQGHAPVTSIMRSVFRVPETKKLSDLLTDFQRQRRTFAIVVDEYGGTSGVVTLEDLLEEVVGDIYDEYDVVRPSVRKLENGDLVLDGRMSIAEAANALGVALPEGDYDSLAGLVYSRLGVVPKVGQVVDLDGIRLIVEELEGHRITRLLAAWKRGSEQQREAQAGESSGPGGRKGDD